MMGTLTCLSALLATVQFGVASRYGEPGDRLAGGVASCRYRMDRPSFRRAVSQGCAHRWLPCGTQIVLRNPQNGRSASCTVVDRGPYGAMYRGRWVIKRRERDPGTWRGVLDLLPPVANRLGVDGRQPLLIHVVKKSAQ